MRTGVGLFCLFAVHFLVVYHRTKRPLATGPPGTCQEPALIGQKPPTLCEWCWEKTVLPVGCKMCSMSEEVWRWEGGSCKATFWGCVFIVLWKGARFLRVQHWSGCWQQNAGKSQWIRKEDDSHSLWWWSECPLGLLGCDNCWFLQLRGEIWQSHGIRYLFLLLETQYCVISAISWSNSSCKHPACSSPSQQWMAGEWWQRKWCGELQPGTGQTWVPWLVIMTVLSGHSRGSSVTFQSIFSDDKQQDGRTWPQVAPWAD